MTSVNTVTAETADAERPPTEYLIRDAGQLSPVMLCRCITEGFTLKDVQAMLRVSRLLSTNQIINVIMGKSRRAIARLSRSEHVVRLTPQQSAVAFQYAKVFEHATAVFGTQRGAEEWLGRPCDFLDGNVPLAIVDNCIGFQVVEDYLLRIEYGVYQ